MRLPQPDPLGYLTIHDDVGGGEVGKGVGGVEASGEGRGEDDGKGKANEGEERVMSLTDLPLYRFASGKVERRFCDRCGVHLFLYGVDEGDGDGDFVGVNVATFDEVLMVTREGVKERETKALSLEKWKMRYWDGKGENWGQGGREEPWVGGML